MKKFIPLVALLGVGLLTTGCASNQANTISVDNNIKEFATSVNEYASINENSGKTILNRYQLTLKDEGEIKLNKQEKDQPKTLEYIEDEKIVVEKDNKNTSSILPINNTNLTANRNENADLINSAETISNETDPIATTPIDTPINENNNLGNNDNNVINNSINNSNNEIGNSINNSTVTNDTVANENDNIINQTDTNITPDLDENENTTDEEIDSNYAIDEISPLYYLTNDINEYSEQFLNLKQNITSAINETESLLNKVNSGEISLTNEQKMMLKTQTDELKELAKTLARSTTELKIHLSDLNQMMLSDDDLNSLSIKYLVILDNLANGNEMLENGLYTLRLINQLFNVHQIQPRINGAVMYGFQRKGEPPIYRNYNIIDGKFVENDNDNNNMNETNQNETSTNELNGDETKPQIQPRTNIDSYGNNYSNIDSFFNTALLDNQFMFGANRYGANGFYNSYNPYVYNNMAGNNYNMPNYNPQNPVTNNNQNNTINGVENTLNTQNNVQNTMVDNSQMKEKNKDNKKKRFRLSKNIDTYRSENTPSLSARIKNIKATLMQNKPEVRNPIFKL